MTQRQTVLKLLKENKKVTLRMLFDAGVAYTGRNRISELRKDGFEISQHNSETPSDNYYILEKEPVRVGPGENTKNISALDSTERPEHSRLQSAQVKFDEIGQGMMI